MAHWNVSDSETDAHVVHTHISDVGYLVIFEAGEVVDICLAM